MKSCQKVAEPVESSSHTLFRVCLACFLAFLSMRTWHTAVNLKNTKAVAMKLKNVYF